MTAKFIWLAKKPNEKKVKFLEEINSICQKYNLSISHEDEHGAFIIEDYDEFYKDWLFQASYDKVKFELPEDLSYAEYVSYCKEKGYEPIA